MTLVREDRKILISGDWVYLSNIVQVAKLGINNY